MSVMLTESECAGEKEIVSDRDGGGGRGKANRLFLGNPLLGIRKKSFEQIQGKRGKCRENLNDKENPTMYIRTEAHFYQN